MDQVVDFSINNALKLYLSDPATIPTPEADAALQDLENDPDSFTPAAVNGILNPIVEAIAENVDALQKSAIFDSLQLLLKSSAHLPNTALSKILDVLVSALSAEADIINSDLEADEQDTLTHHRKMLEMYGFLLQWTISTVETKVAEKPATSAPIRGRGSKGTKAKAGNKETTWDSAQQLVTALDTMCKVLKLKLGRMFLTTADRDTMVGLFTRSVYLIFESEQRVKHTAVKMHAFKVLCIAVKHHGHAFGAQTSIMQNLSYFEHLSEPMAEFLSILAREYDYPQLAEEVLREISTKEFNSNDTKGPKSISSFIIKLSEVSPRVVLKQMTLLAKQLDSEAYTLRCAIIEVCGNLIADLSRQEERTDNSQSQINGFFDVLEERFLDVNPYCRCRTIQTLIKICDLEQKYPKRKQVMAALAARSLEDKSSNVRRNAIKLLGKLVTTHPFAMMHGGQLSQKEWEARLEAVQAELDNLKPPTDTPGLVEKRPEEEQAVDSALLDDATVLEEPVEQSMTEEQQQAAMKKAADEAAASEMLGRLQLTRKYYIEALKFIEILQDTTSIVCQLLSSKNKSEVVEAMDFFVILDAYKLESAKTGIRRMLRLIWTKGNSDEGKGIQTHLIDCYKGLFFDAPGHFTPNDAANYIARNMISLTFGATPAELTSLEQLLSTMMKANHISDLVVTKLWQVYGVQKKEISRNQRRGAIMVLGMLAMADPEIVVREMETMLRIGLGALGRSDLGLAKHTCVALRRINPTGRQAKEISTKVSKLPNDHAVLVRLASMVELRSDSKEWYGVAEQAIGAIYTLAKHPDTLCSDIIRRKTRFVFSGRDTSVDSKNLEDKDAMDIDSEPAKVDDHEKAPSDSNQESSLDLSQLLFLVGHIAIKQIVHLEICEQEFKRRKAEKDKAKSTNEALPKNVAVERDELDLIGGTTEDDFTEAIAHIRERELLYGEKSLLSNFGPMVTELCSNNTAYNDPNLQAAATLCMAKLMCVSSAYCEQNLPLLITILERSHDPITRSNAVIALGDMAVCFNHLIDENTDFLYRRLNDNDASVKRTCLMTLTFLILAGQVKVKGQLGEMAKCLEDSDRRIADLSKMFFTELATKDNAVYNQFVDMFSVLSAEKELEEDAFKRIIKFLASFIEKDKHAKQLADKLAARLARCETERQWNDVAFALSLLPHKNEEISQSVGAGFRVVQANA